MPQHEVANLVYSLIVFSIPLVGVYFNFRVKVEGQERRMTSVEVKLDNIQKQVDNNIVRLNDHEAQQKLLVSLTEQVKNLTSDMGELKADIKSLLRRDS